MRRTGLLAGFGFGLILAACLAPPVPDGPPMACTLIGCESQVAFEIGTDIVSGVTYEVEACIDGLCESATVAVPAAEGQAMGAGTGGSLTLDPQQDLVTFRLSGGDYSGRHAVSLTLVGPDGQLTEMAADTEFERSQPNGQGCEPVCWQAIVRL